ncbi:LIP [Symbiodinium sp. CCMP2456]|nr:LIP [Symbiodinium sp. CCMP2456]
MREATDGSEAAQVPPSGDNADGNAHGNTDTVAATASATEGNSFGPRVDGSEERPHGRLQQAWGRAAAPLAGAASGALGGALGVAAVATGGALGALAAVALAGTLVSTAVKAQAAQDQQLPTEQSQVETQSQEAVGTEDLAEEDTESTGSEVVLSRQAAADLLEVAEPEAQDADTDYAQLLLAGSELLPLVRLLHRLHAKDPRQIEQLCHEEGLVRLSADGEHIPGFFQPGSDTEAAKVFLLGSEADALQRPEAFLECWMQTNARIRLAALDSSIAEEATGHVHEGFQAAWLGVAPALRRLNDSRKVVLVGYSLGGALATLGALDLCCKGFRQVELITFGSPRVGNEMFRNFFREKCLTTGALRVARFVNTLDLVPHVPLNPADAVDATRQGQLWQSVEETLMRRLPQEHLTGPGLGSYVHVSPGTVLDGLSTGLTGMVTRLAAVAPDGERAVALTSLPGEFFSEHSLRSYLRTLAAAPKPAWLTVSSLLLDSARPLRAALGRLGPRPTSGLAEAASAASLGVSVGTMLVPHVLGASVSAVGCFYIAQQVSRVSQELSTQSANTSGRLDTLASAVHVLSQEVFDAKRAIAAGFTDMSTLLQRQNVDNILRRARAGQTQLADDLEVFLARPSTDHVLMIREGARALRGVTAEVLELSSELEEAGAEAPDMARLLEVLLSGTRLALLADALVDEETSALRAAQAFARIAPVLGRFYWQHMGVGAPEPWQRAIDAHRSRFLAVALAVSANATTASVNPFGRLAFSTPCDRLFAALCVEPRSPELRVSLALHLARGQTAGQAIVPSHPWLAIEDDGSHGDEFKERLFLQGLALLLPVPGCETDPSSAAQLWNRLVLDGADLASSLKSFDGEDPLPESALRALAEATRTQQLVPLALALHGSLMLPGTLTAELQAWLSRVVTVQDLQAAQGSIASSMALQQMAHAVVHDARGMEDLLEKSREVFYDLTSMLQIAMAHLNPSEQRAVEELRRALDKDLESLNAEARYLVLGGLVSAGKTSLINAILLEAVAGAREELKEDRGGRLNLMPTSFNENTRIVTELELSPSCAAIEIRLMESVLETVREQHEHGSAGGSSSRRGGARCRSGVGVGVGIGARGAIAVISR